MHRYKLERTKTENITYLNQNKEEVQISKDLLKAYEDYEEEKRRYTAKKNELESFIGNLKNWAEDESENVYLKEEEKQVYLNTSREVDDYIYSDEIETATYQNLTDKVNELNALVTPFKKRKEEHQHRDSLFSVSQERFANYTKVVEDIQKRKTWVIDEKYKDVFKKIYTSKSKLKELYNE